MKKRLAIFGVIAALLMLAACSAAAPEYGTEQTQEQEQIVLHLFHYQGEAEEAYGHVIAAYEKAHPNVKIKSEFLNSENYNSTRLTRASPCRTAPISSACIRAMRRRCHWRGRATLPT